MKRRLFSLFLALTLVVGMLPAPAFAQEAEPTQAVEAPTEAPATEAPVTEAPAEPTQAPAQPTTEAPVPETTSAPVAEAQAPTPTEDEDVAAVQAMIDALPDVSGMSESYIDALEAAYAAYEALTAAQQAKITGAEKLEALFDWVNGQVSTLADDVKEISGEVTWKNETFTTPVKLTGETTLTLVGDNKIECDAPLDLNDYNLTIKGTGSLTVIGNGRSDNRICNGAIFDSAYKGTTYGGGTLYIEGGTVTASGGKYNAISVCLVTLKGGKLEAYGGSNAGIVCSYLYTYSGSLYATGDDSGIEMRTMYALNQGNLPILASGERDADIAAMDASDMTDIQDNGSGNKTYYIGEVSGPMLSVKAQKGYLYEGVADQTATFSYSAKNLEGCMFGIEWTGAHPGLTADFPENGDQTIIVTTTDAVKQGTYELKLTAADAESAKTLATKTFTVAVLGAPITVTTQPKDASAKCPEGDMDSWQGDNEVLVAGTLATGVTEDITYQWKLEDGTPLEGFTQSTLSLKDLYKAGKLTPQADKTWLSSAKVYCTLAAGIYSVNTNTVTLTVNTCNYMRVDHVDGRCLQCGEFHTSDPLLVAESGTFVVVPDESGNEAAKVGGELVSGGTFFLTKDVTHRGLNAGNTTKGDADVILDLQGHTLAKLDMGNFPYGSFTLKNGTMPQCVYSDAEGKLILDGVTFGDACWQATNNSYLEITVQGNTVFRNIVSFNNDYKPVHLRGGTFEKGIDLWADQEALALLDDGFAYQDSNGSIVDARYPENIANKEIRVVAHTCDYVSGRCRCGRTCDHENTVDADGYCTFCGALVYPYAIGQTRYESLENALAAAKEGDTITLRGDFYQGAATVEINKNVTLELGGHTLTSDADGEPVLRILAENVTIRNGTVKNTRTAKSSPAVTVGKTGAAAEAGLTVKNVTFIGSSDGNAPQEDALDIQNGHAKVESGTFNGGIFAQGDLTMTGGSATKLELGYVLGKVELSGGSFDSIYFNANADYAGLLAEGYAYQSGTSLVKPADMNGSTAVKIVKCTHPDGLSADTACPYCGRVCDHKNTSEETGLCPDCGYQVYRAKNGDRLYLYETAEAALNDARDHETVTLLADDTLPDNYVLDKAITLDMNAKKLTGSAMTVTGEVTVSSSGRLDVPMVITGKLTLNGPAATLLQYVSVRAPGTLILDRTTAAAAGTISVYENGRFELRDGAVGTLLVDGGKAILSAGRIMKSVTVKNGNLSSILAEGKALVRREDGTVIDGTGSAATGILDIQDHTHTFGQGGKCACGATAPVQVTAGEDSFYFDDFEEALNKAQSLSGSTLRLLDDVTLTTKDITYADQSGTFTIDWNGHTLTGNANYAVLSFSNNTNVTLKDSIGTGGVKNAGPGAAMFFAVGNGGSVTVEGGTYSPQVRQRNGFFGPVRISGGVFENPAGSSVNGALYNDNGTLNLLLEDGFAFAYDANGSEILNAYGTDMSDVNRIVYAVPHSTHTFDEKGVCVCGYPCPHEHWTDGVCNLCGKTCAHPEYTDGKCTTCGYVCPHPYEDVTENDGVYTCDICGMTMTVMVETEDGDVSYTTDLAAALSNAEDGTYITLLADVNIGYDGYVAGDNKVVTLDMNGHNIAQNGDLCIGGESSSNAGKPAKLIITGSGDLPRAVNVFASGKLDLSGWTGTATYVNLSNVCELVGPTGDGYIGELSIGNWRKGNEGSITLQGGSIGRLWLNSFEDFQITLGSLLRPGYAAKSGSEYLPYDRAIVYSYSGQSDNILNNLVIEPCPHTGLDSKGRCTYCNATGFVASVTKNGVTTGYDELMPAINEICNGKSGTLKLLKNAKLDGSFLYEISGTLDLNGKKLGGNLECVDESNLQIVNNGSGQATLETLYVRNGAKVTIADTIGFDTVRVESGSVADLLLAGCAYVKADGTWISAEEAAGSQSLTNVVVKKAPIRNLTLTANKNTVPYGESQTVTLTAQYEADDGTVPVFSWCEVFPATYKDFTETGTSLTLPEGVNAGAHTYRVSVTADGYTVSKDITITVTKIQGTLENKDYPTEFTYGDTIPVPKAENFLANSTGKFAVMWQDANWQTVTVQEGTVLNAGKYTLHVARMEDTNHTAKTLSLPITVKKAPQTADITVVNETISGKGDGGVTLKPSTDAYEVRVKGETIFTNPPTQEGQTFLKLAPGVTYEIRRAETDNYLPSDIQEITVMPGRKLTVTLPDKQEGYTLTANKTQLDYLDTLELTFTLNPVGAYQTEDFCIWWERGNVKGYLNGDDGVYTLSGSFTGDVTITVTGVALDKIAPGASIRGRYTGDTYVKWDGFAENPADDYVNGDFVITVSDRGSGVANVWYCLSDKPLTQAEMTAASWVSTPLTGTSQAKVSITEYGEYYLYVKVLDKANNPGYACTGKLVKESNPPTFSGVKDGETYYVSQQLEIHDDTMPDWYVLDEVGTTRNGGNENPIRLPFKNDGNSHTIRAADRCGNEASITVHMRPISDLTQPLSSIQADNIRKSDRATLDAVEAALKGLDVTYATDQEKTEIANELAHIVQLRQVLDQVAAVEDQIDALPDSVEPYQQTVEDTQIKPAREAYSSLTDHQKILVDEAKLKKLEKLEAQLDAWTITEGDGQVWYKGSGKPLSFTVNGQSRKFYGILLGEIGPLTSDDKITFSNSIDEPFTVTLKPEYLQSFGPGYVGYGDVSVVYNHSSGMLAGTPWVTFQFRIPDTYLDVTDKPEFDGKTTVTIDGTEYPIEEMGGERYVNLPETGDLLTIYSYKDGTQTGSYTNYPTGMRVYRITRQEGGAKAEEITEFAGLLNYAGCSIRITGKQGIRMITAMDENVKKSLVSKNGLAGYTLEEYGTVVQWVGTLGGKPLNLDSGKHSYAYKKGKADPVFAKADGMIQYTNVLVGFSDSQLEPDLVMRPYITLKDTATGETVTLYGGCVTRSIGYVAWQNRNTYKQGTASYKYVWNIIGKVDTSKYPTPIT